LAIKKKVPPGFIEHIGRNKIPLDNIFDPAWSTATMEAYTVQSNSKVERLVLYAPLKRLVMIGEGTHSIVMEKNRLQLFREVQSFLEEPK
jgi:hypothetical protein